MESQLQNPELGNNPENIHSGIYVKNLILTLSKLKAQGPVQYLKYAMKYFKISLF